MSPRYATDIVLMHRRHIDPATLTVAGLAPCTTELGNDPVTKVAELYEQGARHITLPEPVDLSPAADAERAVRTLVALREMAARAIAVDWELDLGRPLESRGWESMDQASQLDAAFINLISHLNPPRQISGVRDAETLLAAWRSGFFFNACIHRRAPGFIQVRDWRGGELSRITIDEPDYLVVFNSIQLPASAADLPADVLSDFEAENLVGRVGDYVWWVPCQVRRWPVPAMNL